MPRAQCDSLFHRSMSICGTFFPQLLLFFTLFTSNSTHFWSWQPFFCLSFTVVISRNRSRMVPIVHISWVMDNFWMCPRYKPRVREGALLLTAVKRITIASFLYPIFFVEHVLHFDKVSSTFLGPTRFWWWWRENWCAKTPTKGEKKRKNERPTAKLVPHSIYFQPAIITIDLGQWKRTNSLSKSSTIARHHPIYIRYPWTTLMISRWMYFDWSPLTCHNVVDRFGREDALWVLYKKKKYFTTCKEIIRKM